MLLDRNLDTTVLTAEIRPTEPSAMGKLIYKSSTYTPNALNILPKASLSVASS
jgi:hypothetical protein